MVRLEPCRAADDQEGDAALAADAQRALAPGSAGVGEVNANAAALVHRAGHVKRGGRLQVADRLGQDLLRAKSGQRITAAAAAAAAVAAAAAAAAASAAAARRGYADCGHRGECERGAQRK